MRRLRLPCFPVLILALLVLASCSSSDDPTEPAPASDNTAPLVVQVSPVQEATDVAVTAVATIGFNEAMSAASATGNITLSHGTITDLTWDDNQTLEVSHTDWPEGTEVTVTVGTGLQDVAGNALAEAFSWSFFTHTSAVTLLSSVPDDGAVDVLVNTQVHLTFSRPMDETTLPGSITVTSPDKATYDFSVSGEDAGWTLAFTESLPASTVITVTIGVGALDTGGIPLATETGFSFTTGTDADNTPPQIVSFEPAHGAGISTGTNYVRLTFDEPIDDATLNSPVISGQFLLAFTSEDEPGVWSEGNTVYTIGLETPLVPGSVFRVEFDSFADMYGNVNMDGYQWQVTVTGDAQYVPVMDDWMYMFMGTVSESGSEKEEYEALRYQMIDIKTGGEFWVWNYETVWEAPSARDGIHWANYDRYRLMSSELQFLGFHEEYEGGETSDYVFDPPVKWLPLPVTTGTWSGTSYFTHPVAGDGQVDYSGEVLAGTVDVTAPVFEGEDAPQTIWLQCRRVVVDYALGDGEITYEVGQDTIWYAPGAGIVKEVSTMVGSGGVDSSDFILLYAGPFEDW